MDFVDLFFDCGILFKDFFIIECLFMLYSIVSIFVNYIWYVYKYLSLVDKIRKYSIYRMCCYDFLLVIIEILIGGSWIIWYKYLF